MTAQVIDLDARRPRAEDTCTCPAHRLQALARDLENAADTTAGALLVAGPELAGRLGAFAEEARGILAATQPREVRP